MPVARRFPALGATAPDATIPTLATVDAAPQELQAPEFVVDRPVGDVGPIGEPPSVAPIESGGADLPEGPDAGPAA